MKYILAFFWLSIVVVPVGSKAQAVFDLDSLIGKNAPDFTFDKVVNYKQNRASIKDFRGKWLVLDFWDKGCTGCIIGFPHMNKLKEQFQEKIQFLLVASEADGAGEVESLFGRCTKKWKLTLPCAFDLKGKLSDILFQNNGGVPKICVVDPNGVIRYAANGPITREKLEEIYTMGGRTNTKATVADSQTASVAPVIFQSGISPSTLKFGSPGSITDDASVGKVLLGSCSLKDLYFFSLLGSSNPYKANKFGSDKAWKRDEFFKDVILEVKDSSLFKLRVGNPNNYFDYSLQVPADRITKENLMFYLQQDLTRYFGYEARIEKRLLPYFRLVATEQARRKLAAKGDTTYLYGSKAGVYRGKNQPVQNYILAEATDKLAVVDDTGIVGNIDLAFNWVPSDFDSYREALRKNGLDLIEDQKEIYCLVISDPKPLNKSR